VSRHRWCRMQKKQKVGSVRFQRLGQYVIAQHSCGSFKGLDMHIKLKASSLFLFIYRHYILVNRDAFHMGLNC